MRILQIDKFFDCGQPAAGGAGTYIPLVSRYLRRAGHSVIRFGCATDGGPAEMPRFIDYARLTGRVSKLRGAVRILHDFAAADKLAQFLRRHEVDVAHVHRIYHHLTPAILTLLRRRVAAVVMSMRDYRLLCPAKVLVRAGRPCTSCLGHRYYNCVRHGCTGSRLSAATVAFETFFQRFFRRYIDNVDAFLCPSAFMAEVLISDGFPAGKVQVLPNPIEPMQIPQPAEQSQGTILYVGRLSLEKGCDLMLDLAQALPARAVVLAGDGAMMPQLQAQRKKRGLGNLQLAGHVPHDRLGQYYGRADVVVVPSLCPENSPHSLLEAMLAGRCVVAADHRPIREWVCDGQTGRLFRPGDAGHLAAIVGQALADQEARRQMGSAASAVVRARHDPADITKRLELVYQQALGLRAAR